MTAPPPETIEREKDKVPTWVDMPRLCHETCLSDVTVTAWVKQGILPPPKKRGHKLMWKWKEVDGWLTDGPPDAVASQSGDLAAIRERSRHADAPTN